MTLVPHIDILINNAAIPPCPYSKTEDGIETQFATNHLGHFLLTNLLKPTILAAESGARIVSVSSSAHRHREHARFEDYSFSNGKTYSAWEGYMQSKLANVLFSVSLVEKLAHHQVQSFSLHPGPIDSGMQAHVPKDAIANALRQRREEAEREGREIKRAKRKTIQQGCATALVAALDPSIAGLSGNYLEDGNVMENNYAIDNENAERLWILSEELVGQKFEGE
jgi:NAD(P)-dependent dehydrogenase (short-subunit alcohol dehydrogenase family)